MSKAGVELDHGLLLKLATVCLQTYDFSPQEWAQCKVVSRLKLVEDLISVVDD